MTTTWEAILVLFTGAFAALVTMTLIGEGLRRVIDEGFAKGRADLLNTLVTRLAKGGEIVLAGFYTDPLSFAFPPAFMKEARFRIAAEWAASDMTATRALVESGALVLSDLITHRRPATDAALAYETAFSDPACLKMILDWKAAA